MIVPYSRSNLTTAIVEALGKAITCGQPDALQFPLRECELSKQLGVSRSIVREAIKMLTAKGLLTSRPRVGTIVISQQNWRYLDPDILSWAAAGNASLALLRELTELRCAVEPDAVALASTTSTKSDINTLYLAFDEATTGKSKAKRLAAKIAFHQVILRASGNRFFFQTTKLLQTAIKLEEKLLPASDSYSQQLLRREIMLAILASNPAPACNAMRVMIEKTLREVNKLEKSASRHSCAGRPDG